MTYSKEYYEERKNELQQQFQRDINEAFDDIKRAIFKQSQKQAELQKKLQELEIKEKESQKQEGEKKKK